jgi:DNA-binding transcriptional LysR family regulator
MELYQLRTFAAVADEGHLTRASERLHLSQPAVSGQIKALETQLGVRLFERAPSGMVLTEAGAELLQQARRVLAAADEVKQTAQRLNGDVIGTLRVGTVADPESNRLGDLLARSVQLHPRLRLDLHHAMSGTALAGVLDGELDASFYFGDAPAEEIHALRLRQFVYRVTAPAAWIDRIEDAGLGQIANLPWVRTPDNSTHSHLVTRLFATEGRPAPNAAVQADDESVITNLVVSGAGLALVRDDIAERLTASGEVVVWDAASIETTLWFISLARRVGDPLLAALLEAVRATWDIGHVPIEHRSLATVE